MKQLHEVQLKILKDLLFSQSLKYSEIKPLAMENSQFVFHLDRLILESLVEKQGSTYTLTAKGKEYANKMDEEKNEVVFQAKVTAVICAIRQRGKQRDFLIYKRLKNPFYGCVGFPTEKVKWSESVAEAATRGLKEETGLVGKPQLLAIRHYRVLTLNKKLVEDKIMHAFIFVNPTGKLEGNVEGEFTWVRESNLKTFVNLPLEEFWEFYGAFKAFGKSGITFKELAVITDKF